LIEKYFYLIFFTTPPLPAMKQTNAGSGRRKRGILLRLLLQTVVTLVKDRNRLCCVGLEQVGTAGETILELQPDLKNRIPGV